MVQEENKGAEKRSAKALSGGDKRDCQTKKEKKKKSLGAGAKGEVSSEKSKVFLWQVGGK